MASQPHLPRLLALKAVPRVGDIKPDAEHETRDRTSGRGEPPDHMLSRHFSNGNPTTHASSMASNSQQTCVLLTHKHADIYSHQSKGPLATPRSLVNRIRLYELYAILSTPVKQYTDDTAMTKCIAESLITQRKYDPDDLAKSEFSSLDKHNFSVNMKEDIGSCNRFVKEYFGDKNRGYGQQIVEVFHKLRVQKFIDPYGPAKEQFEGTGSYGNGAAMRTAPIALFCHKNYEELLDTARKCAELTHTHKQGYNGAILQVRQKEEEAQRPTMLEVTPEHVVLDCLFLVEDSEMMQVPLQAGAIYNILRDVNRWSLLDAFAGGVLKSKRNRYVLDMKNRRQNIHDNEANNRQMDRTDDESDATGSMDSTLDVDDMIQNWYKDN
uniref:ADP-ribosylhydrolase ARH3 n=1 Tax=Timema douglasi TaxID=61478 RepID=A0A7R8VGZ6_TIMDO|nr:unnamed protein product [Timema douglasi]